MTFSSEQNEALDQKFSQLSEQLVSKFSEIINPALSGLAKRLISEEMPRVVSTAIDPIQQQLTSFQGFDPEAQREAFRAELNAMLQNLAAEDDAAKTNNNPTQSATAPNDPAIANMQKQLEQFQQITETLKTQLQATRDVAEQEKARNAQLAEQQRIASLNSSVIESLRSQGLVRPGTEADALSLLQQKQLLKEVNGAYYTPGIDDIGLPKDLPLVNELGNLIKNHLPYLEAPRGGTGGDTPPSNSATITRSTTQQPTDLKFFRTEGNTLKLDDSSLEAAAASGNMNDLLKELARATQG